MPSIAFPDPDFAPTTAEEVLEFCSTAEVSDQIRANMITACETSVSARARREAYAWAEDKEIGWLVSEEALDLRAKLRKGQISDDTFLSRAHQAEAHRIIELEDRAALVGLNAADAVVRAARAELLLKKLPSDEQRRVLDAELEIGSTPWTIEKLTSTLRTNTFAERAFTTNDLSVVDELRRSQRLATADERTLDVERWVQTFRDRRADQ